MNQPAPAGVGTAVVRVEFNHVAEGCAAGDLAALAAARRSLAVRLAARRACGELLVREITGDPLRPEDFEIRESAPSRVFVELGPRARDLLARRLVADLDVTVECDHVAATATARIRFHPLHVPWFGRWVYCLLPFRRSLALANLRRVFGEFASGERIRRLAEAYYAHLARSVMEMIRLPLMSEQRRLAWVRVENVESPINAHQQGKGVILLTGHFGNWETATVAALKQFPQYAGKFHFLRRTLKPRWFDRFITRRFRQAGFGTLPKRGSMETILKLLGEGAIIVFTFDQHAGRPDGIPVEFLGHPAGTFKSLAILALNTGAPVVPACTWREPDGRHVLRFEDPVPLIEHENVGEAIRQNTRAYNAALERMLLRHPEQWIWMHRRWKLGS
jgi:KDO2-lipid IV(A) lauroyltransferase